MMVDRENRDLLVVAIEKYLNEESTAFSFDEEIFEILDKTSDNTIEYIIYSLWHFYDDCKDHKIVISKESWDLFQRWLLLLQSEAQILNTQSERKWSWTQLTACFAFVAFLACFYQTGFNLDVFLGIAIPFGLISIAISFWKEHYNSKVVKENTSLYPFDSLSQLLAIRREVHHFKKRRYPEQLKDRSIRTPSSETLLQIQSYILWLLFSPLVLIFQMFPSVESEKQVFVEKSKSFSLS